MTLPPFVLDAMEELRRLPCRVDHAKEPCRRCLALEAWERWVKDNATHNHGNKS